MPRFISGILFKLLAVSLVIAGLFIFLSSDYLSQQTGIPTEIWWAVSWIIFIAGLIAFATGVIVQRAAIRRIRAGDEPQN